MASGSSPELGVEGARTAAVGLNGGAAIGAGVVLTDSAPPPEKGFGAARPDWLGVTVRANAGWAGGAGGDAVRLSASFLNIFFNRPNMMILWLNGSDAGRPTHAGRHDTRYQTLEPLRTIQAKTGWRLKSPQVYPFNQLTLPTEATSGRWRRELGLSRKQIPCTPVCLIPPRVIQVVTPRLLGRRRSKL